MVAHPRHRLPFLAAALAAVTVGGCANVQKASAAYDDLFAPVEGKPRVAKDLERAPMIEVLAGPSGWREYEIGRRFELGLGVSRDRNCAARYYTLAAAAPYQTVEGFNGVLMPVTRIGVPFARIALRKLPPANAEEPSGVAARCDAAIRTAAG